jgi:glycerophosphoryl diester phosphodiesterase
MLFSTPMNPLRVGGKFPAEIFNIAHRGARAYAPENTLPAFEKAEMFGCHMFELDTHMSKDGEMVVHHDDDLKRCTDVEIKFPKRKSYFVSDFTYDELQQLDAGSWYVEQLKLPADQRQSFLQTLKDDEIAQYVSSHDRSLYASGYVRIPTLRQALEVAKNTAMMVNIEIKTMPRMYAGIAKSVVQLVEGMDMATHVLISSFDHEQLVEVRSLNTAIPTGVLTSDRLAKPGDYLKVLDADAYNPGCYSDYDSIGFHSVSGKMDARGIAHVRAAGRGVNVWTCNDPGQIGQLIAAGATGIFTDYPNRVRDVCRIIPPHAVYTP